MFILALFIAYSFAGNALNLNNELLLVPYPKKVTADFGNGNTVSSTPSVKMVLPEICSKDEKCLEFMEFNFNHSITYPLLKQTNLDDFRLSVFEQIDIKNAKITKETKIGKIVIEFTKEKIEEIYPKLVIGIDESYVLSVDEAGILIQAPTVYGARHALETLLQLYRPYNGRFVIRETPIVIEDEPRFKWRGLMVDVARNSFDLPIYKRIVNALSALKCNILHIHLSDAQTFMFESKEYPYLSKKGSFYQSKVLTQEFIKELTEYAAKRGVIIYGEIDTPAHTASWNLGYPGVVADSWDYVVEKKSLYGENLLALNPTDERTFKIIDALMKELGETFGNEFVHFGGDEVNSAKSWEIAKEKDAILAWMKERNMTTYEELEGYFNKYAQEQIVKNGKIPVAWEEVYMKGNVFSKDLIVHVWSRLSLLEKALKDGHKVILSRGYYMDMQMPLCSSEAPEECQNPNHMWVWSNRDMYRHDPITEIEKTINDTSLLENFLGGEACSWDESCDSQNFFERVFQRFSAVAERFWSQAEITNPESHEVRANYVRCIGLRRKNLQGTGPLYSNYCQLPEEL